MRESELIKDVPAALDRASGTLAPDRIWLQDADQGEGATWCSEPVNHDDVEYVRAAAPRPTDTPAAAASGVTDEMIDVAITAFCNLGTSFVFLPAPRALTHDEVHRRMRAALEAAMRGSRDVEGERDRYQEALHQIKQWSQAYPTSVFPEPDQAYCAKAHEVLVANGMTLDRLSAAAMRRVVDGVGNIARIALASAGFAVVRQDRITELESERDALRDALPDTDKPEVQTDDDWDCAGKGCRNSHLIDGLFWVATKARSEVKALRERTADLSIKKDQI